MASLVRPLAGVRRAARGEREQVFYMAGGSHWARSGRRPPTPGGSPDYRAPGSFGVAVVRARGVWDGLTGAGYSETASAAIVRLAVALWADTARGLVAPGDGADDREDGDAETGYGGA